MGLDIGTSSVGWACINLNNINEPKILKRGSKSLWGVRLFEDADTAANRRIHRGTRRRYDRRRKRLKRLKNIFRDEINKIDDKFFDKFKTFNISNKDNINTKVPLTGQEKDLYKKYKTIYHIRKEVMISDYRMDIRLIYLAIHHIIKYRGNFLYSGELNSESIDYINKLKIFIEDLNEFSNFSDINIDYDRIKEHLKIEYKKDKIKSLEYDFATLNKDCASNLAKAICGYKFSVNKLFGVDADEKMDISLIDELDNEKESKLLRVLGQDKIYLLDILREVFNSLFLMDLFKGKNYSTLSDLMIDKYETHKSDLELLKKVFRNNKVDYINIFKDVDRHRKNKVEIKDKCLYRQYVNNYISQEDFYKIIIKKLENIDCDDKKEILDRIEKSAFLPRINETGNGRFPYQLNKNELVKIIENQGKYYPFLKSYVDNTNEYKLVRLLSFRIPYYVGPLNFTTSEKGVNNKNYWLTKNVGYEKVSITPYNFDSIVNKDKTAEDFIDRMLGSCTYLIDEKAIPQNSILYSEFKVLQELKQITISNGTVEDKLTNNLVQTIYKEFFLKNRDGYTKNAFLNYLRRKEEIFDTYGNDIDVKGFSDKDKFANNMQSYIDFFGLDDISGFFEGTGYSVENAEEIIRWITIFEDKEILKRKLNQSYPKLQASNVDKILKKKYTGWSKLSKKLLTEIYVEDYHEYNEKKNIMDLLRNSDENFMQILHNKKYNYQKLIDDINSSKIINDKKLSYSIVDKLITSPANKRGIYQALKIIEEIIEYVGEKPKYIYLEMARNDGDKVRTDNRYTKLQKMYDKIKNDVENYDELKKELGYYKDKKITDKIFLYFIQEGKSLYSHEKLDINTLSEDCEIDHILPQSIIKDNSLDNRALVKSGENQIKGGDLVLPIQFRTDENKKWWSRLLKLGLMGIKKYKRLIRNKYSDKDIEGFENRQLVETRQICINVANILTSLYYKDDEETRVLYLNSNLSHNYRDKFNLFKFRELNDYHHAHDAYLAATIGHYYKHIFNKKNIDIDFLKQECHRLFEEKKYNQLSYGFVINSIDSRYLKNEYGAILTDFNPEHYNKVIEDTLYRNDIFISKKTEYKTGEFFNETKKKKGNNGIELKKNLDTKLYGSYTRLNPAYAIMVEYTKNGKTSKRMIGVPIYYQINSRVDDYIKKTMKLKDADSFRIIANKKIPFNSVVNWNGQIGLLVGASDKVELCNALQFKFNKKLYKEWKFSLVKLLNSDEYTKKVKYNIINKIDDIKYKSDLVEILRYILFIIEKDFKLYENLIPQMKEKFNYPYLEKNSIENLEKIIREVFKLLRVNSACADLKFLGMSSYFGKKNRRIIETCHIITKSYTGLKENYYEL